MTCFAYKDGIVCADKQITQGDKAISANKLTHHNGEVLAAGGEVAQSNKLIRWYIAGADHSDFPKDVKDGIMIVFDKKGWREYRDDSDPIVAGSDAWAWGSGAGHAKGALDCGASAYKAVATACENLLSCGLGIDTHDFNKEDE